MKKSPFKSRKLLVAVISAGAVFIAEAFGLKIPPDALDFLKTVVLGYLGAEGAIDAVRIFKKDSQSPG